MTWQIGKPNVISCPTPTHLYFFSRYLISWSEIHQLSPSIVSNKVSPNIEYVMWINWSGLHYLSPLSVSNIVSPNAKTFFWLFTWNLWHVFTCIQFPVWKEIRSWRKMIRRTIFQQCKRFIDFIWNISFNDKTILSEHWLWIIMMLWWAFSSLLVCYS